MLAGQSRGAAADTAASRPAESSTDQAPPIALLYHNDRDVRRGAVEALGQTGDRELIDDLIRARSVENYTPVHNAYARALRTLSGEAKVRGVGAWKAWLAGEVAAGRLKIDYLPLDLECLDQQQRDGIQVFATRLGPEHFETMRAALLGDELRSRKGLEPLRYMICNDHRPEVREFLAGDWLTILLGRRILDGAHINHFAYQLNGLGRPGAAARADQRPDPRRARCREPDPGCQCTAHSGWRGRLQAG